MRVVEVPFGVGVAGQVEPVAAPALAVARRGEQPVDQPLVGVRAPVGQECLDLLRLRQQPGQVEDARRIRVSRSASGPRVSPFSSSFCRMKASMGFRTGWRHGRPGRRHGAGGRNAQNSGPGR